MADDRRTPDHAGELELQRLSSEFLSQMEQVRSLEEQKRDLPPGDERRPELAARIEAMTMELLGRSEYQSRLASAQSDPVEAPIRPIHHVIADWRDAERRLQAAHGVLRDIVAESRAFQEEYQRTVAHAEST